MYYFDIILLNNCNYSENAHKLLQDYKIKHNKVMVNNTNKHLYKTNDIITYPQIYLKKYNNNGSQLIGGYDELKNIIDLVYNKELTDTNINKLMVDYKLSKKATLRVIELINSNLSKLI
jgi:hypothetical protein